MTPDQQPRSEEAWFGTVRFWERLTTAETLLSGAVQFTVAANPKAEPTLSRRKSGGGSGLTCLGKRELPLVLKTHAARQTSESGGTPDTWTR